MVFFFKQDRSTLSDCSHGTCNGFSAQTEPISQCDNDSGDPVRVSVVADNQSVAMKMDKTIRLEPPHFDEEKILYDKFHEAEFARSDLGTYLPDLYNANSDLVVVVVCPDYDQKSWTGLEWIAIHDLLKQRKESDVMLCRFEYATVRGLYSTAGFVELDDKTPHQAVSLILQRLALNEGHSKQHYLQGVGAEYR